MLHRFDEFRGVRLDFVALGDDHPRLPGAGQVVEYHRAAILREYIAQRHHEKLIDRGDRSLGGRVVAAHRLDHVADEFESDWLRFACGIHVEDAAAHRELAVLVHRVLAAEARVDEKICEIGGRNLLPGFEIDRGTQQTRRRRHAREQRGGRRDNDTSAAAGYRVQRARAG